jgi:CheY-like chemotaxis protein
VRRRRAIIFDDNAFIRELLENFLSMKGYEVFSYGEPVVCPLFLNDERHCHNDMPCADVIITDYKMPQMTGVELLNRQRERGCRLDIRNQALISGYVDDPDLHTNIDRLGCAFFSKPFHLRRLAEWIAECEERMPLSIPLVSPRKEMRDPVHLNVVYSVPSRSGQFKGAITNMSRSGFCLRIDHELSDNELTVIDADLPLSCQKASVRWTKRIDNDGYLAGVNCSQNSRSQPTV